MGMEQMRTDGEQMNRLCMDLDVNLHDLTGTAQRNRVIGASDTKEAGIVNLLRSALPVTLPPRQKVLPGPTVEMLKNLDGLADRVAMTDSEIEAADHCKEETVDLLFM